MDAACPTFLGAVCACGCGARYTPVNRTHRLATDRCRVRMQSTIRRQQRREAREKWATQTRICECGCERQFLPVNRNQRFALPKCKDKACRKYRGTKDEASYIGVSLIRELRREVPKHLCIYCELPLRGLQRFVCDRKDADGDSCLRLYNADWRRGERMRRKEPWRKRRRCVSSGCLRTFIPTHEAHCLCWEHRTQTPPSVGKHNPRRMVFRSPR